MSEPGGAVDAVSMRGIYKSFGDTHALRGVDLSLSVGQVHALMGENGAGKSTLLKILTGVQHRDRGEIEIYGHAVGSSPSTIEVRRLGISACYQELDLVPWMSVTDNVMLGREARSHLGGLDRRRAEREARRVISELGVDIPLRTAVSSLTVGQQQLVAIARSIATGVKILILDEPTAALTAGETDLLFQVIRRLVAGGVPVLYVTHRLEEVFEIADVVTVLRDGAHVATLPVVEVAPQRLVALMTGQERGVAESVEHRSEHREGEPALAVEGLSLGDVFEDVSFSVWPGEVVGLAGSSDSGALEVASSLFGRRSHVLGRVRFGGERVDLSRPRSATRAGFAIVPEDRKAAGLCLNLTPMANISLTHVNRYVHRGRISRGLERSRVQEIASRVRLDPAMVATKARCARLSGGNQQKVLLAKWLYQDPTLLILAEPTRGVDVAARADIHDVVREMASRGIPVLVASSDIEEILAISDRVLVMRRGRIVDEVRGSEASREGILSAMLGAGATEDVRSDGVDNKGL